MGTIMQKVDETINRIERLRFMAAALDAEGMDNVNVRIDLFDWKLCVYTTKSDLDSVLALRRRIGEAIGDHNVKYTHSFGVSSRQIMAFWEWQKKPLELRVYFNVEDFPVELLGEDCRIEYSEHTEKRASVVCDSKGGT